MHKNTKTNSNIVDDQLIGIGIAVNWSSIQFSSKNRNTHSLIPTNELYICWITI